MECSTGGYPYNLWYGEALQSGTHGIKSISLLMALVMATGSDEEDEDGKLKEGRMRGLGDVFTIPGLDIDISLAQNYVLSFT